MADESKKKILSLLRFSVSLHGRGPVMADLILSDGCQRLPNVTWYDRSPKVRAMIASEIELQLSELVTPETRERAKRARANFLNPPPTQVQVHFSGEGTLGDKTNRMGKIRIVGRRAKRELSYSYNPESWDSIERMTDAALQAILQVA
jgi:hypothetical protein